MVVLRAIGRFFARIGRWIRDTAWVQPLLIVGGIFAVIFSIPYITKWVQSWFKEGNPADSFYGKYALSYKNIENHESEIDDLFKYMEYMENPTEENAKARAEGKEHFGEKFFLAFVQKDCEACEQNFTGYKLLRSEWGKGEFSFNETYKKEDFKMHTIFIDEINDKGDNLFKKYVLDGTYTNIFEEASNLDNPYLDNEDGVNYENIHGSSADTFTSPTNFLVDFKADNRVTWDFAYGVTEIAFTFTGKDSQDTNYGIARTIWDFWNHQGVFAENEKIYL